MLVIELCDLVILHFVFVHFHVLLKSNSDDNLTLTVKYGGAKATHPSTRFTHTEAVAAGGGPLLLQR